MNINPLSVPAVQAMKRAGEKIVCLTAYDASFSTLLDTLGVDIILVGDSLGTVIQGQRSTVPVTVDDVLYHTRCVTRKCQRSLVMADLPFMSYSTPPQAAENAAKLLQFGGAQLVKLEGAKVEVVSFLVAQGIPVCGHLGLLPQSVYLLGGYPVQAKTPIEAEILLQQAHALQHAGASLLILECIPATLAKQITAQLNIPVIGIGAGIDCDGQVLVLHDMLGLTPKPPRFVKNFMDGAASIAQAVETYCHEVKHNLFPTAAHSYL